MPPYKSGSGRGTYVFDRRIPGIGRFRTHSGTTDAETFAAYDEMITKLLALKPPRADLVEAIRDRRVTFAAVLDAFDNHRLNTLELSASATTRHGDLKETWKQWVEDTPNPKTAAARKGAFKALSPLLPGRNPTNSDLPVALLAYRRAMVPRKQPAMFNRVRAAVSAFLRDHVSVEDRAYISTVLIATMKERKHKRPAPTPEQAMLIRDMLEADYAAAWWAMYCTGMGPEEFWGKWTIADDHIHILGTKREARDRAVPFLEVIARPTMHPRTFLDHFTVVVGGKYDFEPYDARRGFRRLLGDARIETVRIKQYMGHEVDGNVTDAYGKSVLAYHFAEDAAAMRGRLDVARARIASGVKVPMPGPKPSDDNSSTEKSKGAGKKTSSQKTSKSGQKQREQSLRARAGVGAGRRRRAGSPLTRTDGEG